MPNLLGRYYNAKFDAFKITKGPWARRMWLIVFIQLLNAFNERKTISKGYWGCKVLFSEIWKG